MEKRTKTSSLFRLRQAFFAQAESYGVQMRLDPQSVFINHDLEEEMSKVPQRAILNMTGKMGLQPIRGFHKH